MNVSFALVDKVLQTLPIGYYLGTGAKVSLSPIADTAYCCPGRYEIVVSYPLIKKLAHPLPSESSEALENDIRCLLYHELSHLLLTCPVFTEPKASKNLCGYLHDIYPGYREFSNKDAHAIINIFEDERIETIMRNKFNGVDFPTFIAKVNGGRKAPAPITYTTDEDISRFYAIVRFHTGTPEEEEAVFRAIAATHNISRFKYNECYIRAIGDLWAKLVFPHQKPTTKKPNLPTPPHESNPSTDSPETEPPTFDPLDFAHDDFRDKFNDASSRSELSKTMKKLLRNEYYDVCKAQIDRIFKNALAKKATLAGSHCGYSGVVDPRLCSRDDYRWFAKPVGSDAARYSKVKLNLFIDVSGSFSTSESRVNALIRALSDFETENKDFSFDVVKINTDLVLADKDDRYIKCCNGNLLPKKIFDIFGQVQARESRVYNLVVFDGDALSDDRDRTQADNFKVFNHENVSVIADKNNEDYFKQAPLAKVTLVNDSYERLFLENVFATLTAAFA